MSSLEKRLSEIWLQSQRLLVVWLNCNCKYVRLLLDASSVQSLGFLKMNKDYEITENKFGRESIKLGNSHKNFH